MRALFLAVLFAGATAAPAAQPTAPDWGTRPALAEAPVFVPPVAETHALSNGLRVLFVEKPGVPLAQVNLLVRAGSVDDGAQDGLASLTADLMDEGAGDLDALALADAIDFLGIGLSAGAGLHSLQVRLHTPLSKLDDALALMADVALRPTFAQADLDRVRTSRVTALEQRRDEARSIASVAFDRIVFGPDHPYGRSGDGTPASLEALSRDDLAAFHDRAFEPDNAALVVVGALTWEAAEPRLEAAFGAEAWAAREGAASAMGIAEPAQVGPRAITFVDKPGAAQSVIRIGRIGAARSTPDYEALLVLNTILGGSFTSRLNQNLRERNGYSYGARSSFDFRTVSGPFLAYADVQTDVTAPALTEFVHELTAIREPVPADELAKARDNLALSFPEPFATVAGTAAMVGALWLDGLPPDTYATYATAVRAVTANDLARVAARYIDPDRMAIVVVGDWSVVGDEVQALGLGPVEVLSVEDVLGPMP